MLHPLISAKIQQKCQESSLPVICCFFYSLFILIIGEFSTVAFLSIIHYYAENQHQSIMMYYIILHFKVLLKYSAHQCPWHSNC